MSRPHTPETIQQVRDLWNQGLSANTIAKQLGMAKNSVIGMAHRNGFAARESPIKKRPNYASFRDPGRPYKADPGIYGATQPRRLAELPASAPHYFALGGGCRWIEGEPGMYASMCGKDRVRGRPYCAKHAERALAKVRA